MNMLERRATAVLSCVYMSRMFGLFILLPILAPVAKQLQGATPLLVGLALGIYGLPQIFLQALFGAWSDVIGRKPVIICGLMLFITGCLVAAAADTIYGIICGRILQGSGAIAATVMAFATDLIREEQRTKAIAIIGTSIGAAFILAVVSGPVLQALVGLHGVFLTSASFALIAVLMVAFALPERSKIRPLQGDTVGTGSTRVAVLPGFRQALGNIELQRLSLGIFALHAILVANFLVLPELVHDHLGFGSVDSWRLYAPVLVGSFILMLPFILIAERYGRIRQVMLFMLVCLSVSQVLFHQFHGSSGAIVLSMLLFFVAFNYLEASLPSLVSRLCATNAKGVSLGIFMQSQFLGTFCGGVLGGMVLSLWSATSIYLMNISVVLIWLVAAWGMAQPRLRRFHTASSKPGFYS